MGEEATASKEVGEITQQREPSTFDEGPEKYEVPTRIQTQRHLKSRHVQLMVGLLQCFPIL